MNKTGIAALALLVAVVACGCATKLASAAYVPVADYDEARPVIVQYAQDNHYVVLDQSDVSRKVVSEWVPAGGDDATEYNRQLRIAPQGNNGLSVRVALRRRGRGKEEWLDAGCDAAEQERIADDLKSILN